MIGLADIKAELGIAGTADDAWLTGQLEMLAGVVETYTRRRLVRAMYEDTFFRPDGGALQLSEFPVHGVTSVEKDGTAQAVAKLSLESKTGRLHAAHYATFAGAERISVTYDAGYDPLPPDLRLVIVSLLRGAYDARATGGLAAATSSSSTSGGDVRSVTAFNVMKVDFTQDTTSGGSFASGSLGDDPVAALLGNHVGVLARYVDHAKSQAWATG